MFRDLFMTVQVHRMKLSIYFILSLGYKDRVLNLTYYINYHFKMYWKLNVKCIVAKIQEAEELEKIRLDPIHIRCQSRENVREPRLGATRTKRSDTG